MPPLRGASLQRAETYVILRLHIYKDVYCNYNQGTLFAPTKQRWETFQRVLYPFSHPRKSSWKRKTSRRKMLRFLTNPTLYLPVLQFGFSFCHVEIKESVAYDWVISLIERCLCERGLFWLEMRKNWPKLVFLSDMKTQLKFLWVPVEEQVWDFWFARQHGQRPLSHSSRPTHFRQSSVILKTVGAMSGATALMLSSVAIIYTKKCLPELDATQTARLQCRTWNVIGGSVINWAGVTSIFLWHSQLETFFFPFPSYLCKASFNLSRPVLRSCGTLTATIIVTTVIVRGQRLFIVSSQTVII